MSMTDPTDELLDSAFRRDYAAAGEALRDADVTGRVLQRIRARQKLRAGLLTVAAGVGLAVTAASLAPALQGLTVGLPDVYLSSPVLLSWLMLLGAGSMLVLGEEAL